MRQSCGINLQLQQQILAEELKLRQDLVLFNLIDPWMQTLLTFDFRTRRVVKTSSPKAETLKLAKLLRIRLIKLHPRNDLSGHGQSQVMNLNRMMPHLWHLHPTMQCRMSRVTHWQLQRVIDRGCFVPCPVVVKGQIRAQESELLGRRDVWHYVLSVLGWSLYTFLICSFCLHPLPRFDSPYWVFHACIADAGRFSTCTGLSLYCGQLFVIQVYSRLQDQFVASELRLVGLTLCPFTFNAESMQGGKWYC